MSSRLNRFFALAAVSVLVSACGKSSTPPSVGSPMVTDTPLETHQAAFVNGDFENDPVGTTPPTGWTVQNYLNIGGVSGTASAPPSSFAALSLSGLGTAVNETYTVGGNTLSQVDPDLGAAQPFRYPIYGGRSVRVNYKDASAIGKNKNSNLIRQSMTIGLGDIDPSDGLAHVRFVVAPVLENPSHAFNQQPYFFIELLNLTRGTTLYTGFNVAGQAGVPWKTTTSLVTGNAVQWLDWQLVDISTAGSAVSIGDQVQLTVVASGCSLGGHFGRIYVDGMGTTIPGPYVTATAPATVNAGATLTYTMRYANGGSTPAVGAHVDMVTPPNTTFASLAGVAGCTTPAVGATGTISCPLGTLNPGATGTFTVTVTVAAGATSTITNGYYSIGSVTAPTLLGMPVKTTVNGAGTHYADIVVTKTSPVTSLTAGQVFTAAAPLYTITVTNTSTTDQIRASLGKSFTLTDVMPAALTNATWDCAVTVNGTAQVGTATKCRDAAGGGNTSITGATGNVSISPRLGYSGGQITIKVYGTISASATGTVVNTVTASAPSGITDPNLANNSATVSLPIGTPRTLTVTKAGTGTGTVVSTPAGISCGATCSTNTVQSAQVMLTASPAGGGTFTGWSGAAGCSTATTCLVTLGPSNLTVTATFTAAPAAGAPAAVYVYGGGSQRAPTSTAFAAPLQALVTDAAGTPLSGVVVTYAAPVGGASATLGAGTATSNASGVASLTATANATPGSYQVTASVAGVASPATFSLTNVGPPAVITYVNGGNASDPQLAPINAPFNAPLMALVTDAAGNPVPNATVTYTVVPAGAASATLSSVTATTDASGFSSVTATANGVVGSYTATASVAGVATPATFSLQNVSTGPAAIFIVSGNPQTTPTGTAFGGALVVVVADIAGNALPNVTVTWAATTVSGATATLSSASTVTNASGLASITATANATGGKYAVNAIVSGVATPATFSLTNDAGYSIQVQSGSPQTTVISTAFANSLQVLVLDGTGAGAAGQVVTFQAPTSGATATLSGGAACVPAATGCRTATTAASGIATLTATANGTAGAYSVVATTPNAPGSATFNLANQCTASSQCGGTAPICSGTTNACVACANDAACSAKDASKPWCDVSGACLACLNDAQCGVATAPICSQATSSCTGCTTDAQCANKNPAAPACIVATGICVPTWTITGSAGPNGSITPSGGQTVVQGASLGFTIMPSANYHVLDVLVDGAPVGAVTSYTFTNVTAAHTIAASFAIDTRTVTASAGANGSISPSGAVSVPYGSDQAFTITPAANHHVADVLVDAASVGAVASYAFTNVTAAHTIAASFAVDWFAFTVTAGPGGTVTCPSPVDYGLPASCTITPDPGWVLATFTDNGVDGYAAAATGTYLVPSVTADHAIVATFSRSGGTACTTGADCSSGHCTDGVCCDQACSGQCQACGVPGRVGTCAPVTGAPLGGRAACASDGSACGGACNGVVTAACTYPIGSCRAGTCAGGTATLAAACDGAGACPVTQTQACSPYACDAAGVACLGTCSVDADCAAGRFCSAGICADKLPAASSCASSSQCASGACTDGVCCDRACNGQCEACNLTGHVGTCTPATGAPVGARAPCASDGSACGGACDGVTGSACTYPTASCRAATCTGGTATLAAACDGAGACPATQTQSCAPYVCDGGGVACAGNCTADSDCSAGRFCAAGVCTDKLPAAAACASGAQCASGFCTDGVCCDQACGGQCEACDVAGQVGTCAPVVGSPRGARTACTTDGSSCGGACDGSSRTACSYPTATCRSASCAGGVATLAGSCDGAGHCPAPSQQACTPYVCGATACAGTCTDDAGCVAGDWCSAGVCVPRLGDGLACGGDHQCQNGHCVDGLCCDGACGGQCEACNVAGLLGQCSAVAGPPRGGRAACATDGTACGGQCDGSDRAACGYPGPATTCRAASCTAGASRPPSTCDAAGACVDPASISCGAYACSGASCATSCTGAADCAPGNDCVGGSCVPSGSAGELHARGSGGCSSAGAGELAPLGLLALLGLVRRRRRAAGGAALLVVLLLSLPAKAEVVDQVDVSRFQPLGGANDLLGVASARTAGDRGWQLGLLVDYARDPLRLVGPSGSVALVHQATNASLSGTLGWGERWELSLVVPVTLAASGQPASDLVPGLVLATPGSGLGDLRLTPRFRIGTTGQVAWAILVPVTFPTATAAYAGQGSVTVSPRAAAEYLSPGGWRLDLNLGMVLRQAEQFVDLTPSSALTYAVGGEVPLGSGRWSLLATATGEVASGKAEQPAELLVAACYRLPSGLAMTVGGGPGLSDGYGTPSYRLLAGLSWTAPPRAAPPAEPRAVVAAAKPVPLPPPPVPLPPPPVPKAVAPHPAAPAAVAAAAPVPLPPPPVVRVEKSRIVILQQIQFATASDVIQPASSRIVDEVAAALKDHPGIDLVRIEGHTDDVGGAPHNLDLSARRAARVRKALIQRGIAAGRLESKGYGQSRPIATNTTPAGRQANRRVEFIIVKQAED